MFASMNQLDFKTPSRRDDMISLCYLLSFLLNEGKFKDIDFNKLVNDQVEAFIYIKEAKKRQTLGDLCYNKAECLIKFAYKTFDLKFEDEINYEEMCLELKLALSQAK